MRLKEIPSPNIIFNERFKDLVGEEPLAVVARKINMHPETVRTWTIGRNMPNADALMAIARGYNVSVDYLLGLTEEKEPASAATDTSSEVSSKDDTNNIPCTHDITDLHICQERIVEKCREVLEILKEFRLKDMLCLCVQDDDNYISFFSDEGLNYAEFNGEEVTP